MSIPRQEHPKPQFERQHWMNLNGEWDFCFDNGRSGERRGFYKDGDVFDRKITVPFCVESELSGIGHKDFIYGVWYRRTFSLTSQQASSRVVFHIGAADYRTVVYVNGERAGEHSGGYVSFSFDITKLIKEGENTVAVCCEDDTRCPLIPRGKQCEDYYSRGCDYTRTTGIWQTVWLEFTPFSYVESFKFFPDYRNGTVAVTGKLCGCEDLDVFVSFGGAEMGGAHIESASGVFECEVKLAEKHLWEVGRGRLYDVKITFGADAVKTYFGLRNVWLDGYKFMLNGKSVFQRLVLDQGFYPDGIYTAPSDEALHNDIKLSMACGFNGARLHQKVFEERFLYHCDKEGYMVWGEYANWGLDHTRPDSIYSFLPEWTDEVERDFNHPSIVGWCPFNETWDMHGCKQFDPFIASVYKTTKAIDNTRPCIDTSGGYHVVTDIFDVHDYEQNAETYKARFVRFNDTDELENHCNNRQKYTVGQPVFMSEYGGIKWSRAEGDSWGYGDAPASEEEYKTRYKELTDVLLDRPKMMGFCYTQLTDVEQEQNGVYFYDRTPKFDAEFFRSVNSREAAIEKE